MASRLVFDEQIDLKMWHLLIFVGFQVLAQFGLAAVFYHFLICEHGEAAAVVVVVAVAAVATYSSETGITQYLQVSFL